MDKMYIEDLNGEQYPLRAAVDRDRGVNGEKAISFSLYEEKWNKDYFKNIDACWKVGFDGDDYEIVIPRSKARGKKAMWELKAVHRFFIDMGNSWIYETVSGSKTLADRLNFVFDGSGFNFVIVGSFSAQDMENFGDSSRLDLFQKILTQYEVEFEIAGNTIYIRSQVGQDTDFVYHRQLNLKDISIEKDSTNFSTYGEGFGADGLHVTYTSPLAAIPGIGIRHHPPIRDDRFKIQDNLFKAVKKNVDESLVFSITVDVAELRGQGFQGVPNEGDRIFVMDDRLSVNIETRIINISEKFDVNGKLLATQVTLSNKGIRDAYQSQISNTVKQLQDILEGRMKIPYNVLDDAVKLATEALQKAQTELLFENGIVAVSKTNPNLMVLLNSAGLGVSIDGGQTFENAITAFGVNTNLLTAGAIHTNNIQIIGTESYFFWDGNEFLAMDPNNQNKYVKITPGFIDVAGGAIRIKRPDGYTVIDDGLANFDFSVDEASPPFLTHSAYIEGRWIKTKTTDKSSSGFYTFKKTGRYICFQLAFFAESGNSGWVHIETPGDNPETLSSFSFNTNDEHDFAIYGRQFVVDLGTPNGNMGSLYVRVQSNTDGKVVGVRKLRVWLQG
ncbi:phage tail protein [Priestia aryabhattai]|uniref:phage tail protein n=1 Tax=Priestia aryabhattai TaxID=412384 RepID=UPI002E1ADD42|nr:phage tail protein [Priestia aryabhattai]MED4261367.1 phage tail protein [Priestia aryabhattai]